MGDFTQNLLKLTEFPFSYSLMGLLALIFGQGINLEELSFAKIGPLLILTGFVATTLSICDPVGALQRRILYGRGILWDYETKPDGFLRILIFHKKIGFQFIIPYIFAIRYSPEEIKSLLNPNLNRWRDELSRWKKGYWFNIDAIDQLKQIGEEEVSDIGFLFLGLKGKTVKTKWITAEMDRITSLIYFMVVISLFIGATLFLPGLLHKFAGVFADTEVVRLTIVIFSIGALVAITYMLNKRISGLRDKALIVFGYLTTLQAIKVDKEEFDKSLKEIERYLNDGDWTLAEFWVKRIQEEYTEVFLRQISDAKTES